MNLLEMDMLSIGYGNVPIIKSVSMTTEETSVVCLIGRNGAGKSTILKCIIGLLNPDDGTILFKGEKINDLLPSDRVKRGISMCPEGRRIFQEMTVFENLKIGSFLRKDKNQIEEDFLEIYEAFPILGERRRQRAGNLSGGEQQMLAIGRALMSRPILLLLDEPSLGLAPLMVQAICKIIEDLNKRGIAIILVEQNAGMALKISTKGYVIENGRIVLTGKSSELLDNKTLREAYLGE